MSVEVCADYMLSDTEVERLGRAEVVFEDFVLDFGWKV